MFNKKCKRCGKKINKNFNFCPFCGLQITRKEDWGLLGRSDFSDEKFSNPFFGPLNPKILNHLIGNAIKMLEKEMERMPETKFKLMVNGREVEINPQKETKQQNKIFTNEQLKKFSTLQKKEPKTNLRRIGDKIYYEVEMNDVKKLKDIVINKLENGIEIKAIGEKYAYYKVIPINMAVTKHHFSKGKLILELKER